MEPQPINRARQEFEGITEHPFLTSIVNGDHTRSLSSWFEATDIIQVSIDIEQHEQLTSTITQPFIQAFDVNVLMMTSSSAPSTHSSFERKSLLEQCLYTGMGG